MEDTNSTPVDWLDASSFDAVFGVRPGETTFRIFRDAYGDDYPAEVEPFSFITRTDLAQIARLLALGPEGVLVDLGCGRGGPGLWLARESGADLIGIDLSANAIVQAETRLAEFGLAGCARFLQRNLCATGLPDRSCDGAVSIDVLMFVEDKLAVMQEVARILRTGGVFIFTAFEDRDTELYRQPLLDNGFSIEVYEEKPDWRRRQLIVYERTLAEKAALFGEFGDGARFLVAEAEHFLADGLKSARHVFVVGRRR